MKNKLDFLKSTRFWKLTIVSILVTLQANGVIDSGMFDAIATILELTLGGSVVIRTVDRFAEEV